MICDLSDFTPHMEMHRNNFYKNLLLKNIDKYETKYNDLKIKGSPLLLKRFMLKISHVINTCYSNNEFKLDERIMKGLNQHIIHLNLNVLKEN